MSNCARNASVPQCTTPHFPAATNSLNDAHCAVRRNAKEKSTQLFFTVLFQDLSSITSRASDEDPSPFPLPIRMGRGFLKLRISRSGLVTSRKLLAQLPPVREERRGSAGVYEDDPILRCQSAAADVVQERAHRFARVDRIE